MLFLGGWALPSDFWQYHMVDFTARGMRCIAYDRRGHGRSDDPGTGYDYDTLADDLASVLESLDLADVTVVAYSMSGGEIARYLTRHGRKRIARVVFLAATAPFLMNTPDNPDGVPAEMFALLRKTIGTDYAKWLIDSEAAYWVGMASVPMQAWARELMLQASLPALVECSRTMTSTDLRPDLRKMEVPTLVIHGDRDVSAPLHLTGAQTAKLVPGARLVTYAGAAHGLPLTHRDRMTHDVIDFMGG